MIIAVSLWFMAFISTCFAIPLVICAKRGWTFTEKGEFTATITTLSTTGVLLAIIVVVAACIVYILPLLPTIMVIP